MVSTKWGFPESAQHSHPLTLAFHAHSRLLSSAAPYTASLLLSSPLHLNGRTNLPPSSLSPSDLQSHPSSTHRPETPEKAIHIPSAAASRTPPEALVASFFASFPSNRIPSGARIHWCSCVLVWSPAFGNEGVPGGGHCNGRPLCPIAPSL